MLFHSPLFLFAFLPITLAGFFAARRWGSRSLAMVWLTAASLVFYGTWNPASLWLLGVSIVGNLLVGTLLMREGRGRRTLLGVGIAANLALLGYFKYANFFVDVANAAAGTSWAIGDIVLPLGISFFTFEQIAWLVELYQGKLHGTTALQYFAFITNFPRLVAGPIIRPHELLPQLRDEHMGQVRAEHLSVGLTIFVIGLFKKVVLADTVALFASPVFDAVAMGSSVTLLEAWGGLLAYTLQLYFDFSGYSDMAIGLARMLGFVLPLNFDAPYRSLSIIDFWRRWHMSLSRFVRDYVYIPLGGSRRGAVRRWVNLFLTMVVVGLWHGAGWTFVAWGALHGAYLIINHAWRALRVALWGQRPSAWWSRGMAWAVTMLAVVVAWVFFRAASVPVAIAYLRSLIGTGGVSLPGMLESRFGPVLSPYGLAFDLQQHLVLPPSEWARGVVWIVVCAAIALLFPTTQQVMRRFRPALDAQDGRGIVAWAPTVPWAVCIATMAGIALLFLLLSQESEFLYFQF